MSEQGDGRSTVLLLADAARLDRNFDKREPESST